MKKSKLQRLESKKLRKGELEKIFASSMLSRNISGYQDFFEHCINIRPDLGVKVAARKTVLKEVEALMRNRVE